MSAMVKIARKNDHINVYLSRKLWNSRGLPPIIGIPELTFPGFACSSDDIFKRQFEQEQINDDSHSAIFLTSPTPNTSGEYGAFQKVRLAHEIGHMLIQNGNEHLDNTGSAWGKENLMNEAPDSDNVGLTPKQFIEALRYKRSPNPYIREKSLP